MENTFGMVRLWALMGDRMSAYTPKLSHLYRHRSSTSLLAIAFSLSLLAAPGSATAQIVPVCDRTPEVRDEIVRLVPAINDCAEVTTAHLASIEGEFFHSGYYSSPDGSDTNLTRRPPPPVRVLRVGDFSGLSSVTTLYLDRTPLVTVPAGTFSDLFSLQNLDLSGAQLTSLPAGVFFRSRFPGNSRPVSLTTDQFTCRRLLRPLLLGSSRLGW